MSTVILHYNACRTLMDNFQINDRNACFQINNELTAVGLDFKEDLQNTI